MMSTRKDEPLLSPEAVRAMYRRGLDLVPGASVAFTVIVADGSELTILVRNVSEGLVEASCQDARACDELQRFVGFRVAGTTATPALRRAALDIAAPERRLRGANAEVTVVGMMHALPSKVDCGTTGSTRAHRTCRS